MSDKALRSQLIRLAHQHPEFRKDILPLVTACDSEGPMMGKFEEGKPADPTSQMSPEDAKKWEEMNDKHKDNFKGAGTDKRAARAVARRMTNIVVRVTQVKPDRMPKSEDGDLAFAGIMTVDFGGETTAENLRFVAGARPGPSGYTVTWFHLQKSLSGSGAEFIERMLSGVLQEVMTSRGDTLLGAPEMDAGDAAF